VATQRKIRKRIKSVASTRKITKTMEMVSTAKMKKMQTRLQMSKPYSEKIGRIITHLRDSGVDDVVDPLLQERADPTRILIVMITGNRGLCGGFNTNVIDNTLAFKNRLAIEEGKEVLLYTIGKKGNGYLKFIEEPVYKFVQNLEDKLTFNEASAIGSELKPFFKRRGRRGVSFLHQGCLLLFAEALHTEDTSDYTGPYRCRTERFRVSHAVYFRAESV